LSIFEAKHQHQMLISFVGAGNVAWHLSQALEQAGHSILEVYSRDIRNARQLSKQLYDTQPVAALNFAESKAELIVLAVADDALAPVIAQLVLPENCLVVHTSGTKSLQQLQQLIDAHSDVPAQTGVFYPLQTFSKQVKIDFAEIPICIEATHQTTANVLVELAHQISNTVYLVDSEERKKLHLAAVFACNFSNHLLAIAKRILDAEDLEFGLLKPLINETVRKALEASDPATVQTGPARRNDRQTMHQHLEYLEQYPRWQALYEALSESITKTK
jgi:predicted short-subunit dehydrogenase-like oxidoreductase (DUF2520 family)